MPSLDGLLDLPSRLILHCRPCPKADQRHLSLIAHSHCGDVHKVVHLVDELIAPLLSLTIIVPELGEGPAGQGIGMLSPVMVFPQLSPVMYGLSPVMYGLQVSPTAQMWLWGPRSRVPANTSHAEVTATI